MSSVYVALQVLHVHWLDLFLSFVVVSCHGCFPLELPFDPVSIFLLQFWQSSKVLAFAALHFLHVHVGADICLVEVVGS